MAGADVRQGGARRSACALRAAGRGRRGRWRGHEGGLGEFLRPPAEGPSPGEGLRGETGGEAGGAGNVRVIVSSLSSVK